MRRAARVDANQSEVVSALEQAGAAVQSLSGVGDGCPDLLVWYEERLFLLEVKNREGRASRPSGILKPDQKVWHERWPGKVHLVFTPQEALDAIGA